MHRSTRPRPHRPSRTHGGPASRRSSGPRVRGAASAAALALGLATVPAALGQDVPSVGFEERWAVSQWSVTPPADGEASLVAMEADAVLWSYRADDPDGGSVAPTDGGFVIPVLDDGRIRFDWRWTGDHGEAAPSPRIRILSLGADGELLGGQEEVFDSPSGRFAFDMGVEMDVEAGGSVSVELRIGANQAFAGARGTFALDGLEFDAGGFRGDAAVGSWTLVPMDLGVTTVSPPAGETDSVSVLYTIPGGGAVPPQTAEFRRVATADAVVSLDYLWSGLHSFGGGGSGSLRLFVRRASGLETVVDLVPPQSLDGAFEFSGTGSVRVREGDTYGIRLAGASNSSSGVLNGSVVLDGFERRMPGPGGLAPVADWIDLGLADAVTMLEPRRTRATFAYDADLTAPGPGESVQVATFEAGHSAGDDQVRFDWVFEGDHAAVGSSALAQVQFIDPDGSVAFTDTLFAAEVGGPFSAAGSYVQLIFGGERIRIVVGGEDPTVDGTLAGELAVSSFAAPIVRCPADLDRNGTVDFDDLLEVLSGFGGCAGFGCPGDVNDDESVDFDDVLGVLAAFGDC